jgi:hypothetical protein
MLIKSNEADRDFHALLMSDKVRFIGSTDDPTLDPAFLDE